MNEALARLREKRDPQCYTERPAGFMPYSTAIQVTRDSTQGIEVVNAEPVRCGIAPLSSSAISLYVRELCLAAELRRRGLAHQLRSAALNVRPCEATAITPWRIRRLGAHRAISWHSHR